MFQIGIIQLPGSNCERETKLAIRRANMKPVDIFWFQDTEVLAQCDGFVIIGGFSYEDRCRSGAIAALDPMIQALILEAQKGKPIIGICNGAQILVESGLVPGCVDANNRLTTAIALAHNRRIKDGKVIGTGFYNTWCDIQSAHSPKLHIPLAHAEGRFVIPDHIKTLIEKEQVTTWHYIGDNPNGSDDNLAAVGNFSGNILAIMPHPERTPNGDYLFSQMQQYLKEKKPFKWVTYPQFDTANTHIQSYPTTDKHRYFTRLNISDNEAVSVEMALKQHDILVSIKKYDYWEIDADTSDLQKIESTYELWNPQKQTATNTLPNRSNTTTLIVFDKDDTISQQKCDTLKKHYHIDSLVSIKRGKVWQLTGAQDDIHQAINTTLLFNPISQTAYLFNTSLYKTGKVREIFQEGNHLLIKTTNRLTAFDRYLCDIPNKGAILTQLSAWWFQKTKHIIPNHFIELINENTMRVKKCKPIPIEVVVRGYLTGSTNTAIWTLYQNGQRTFFDTTLPDGLNKNDALSNPIITPTTKSHNHDEPLTPESLKTLLDEDTWHQIKTAALSLFKFGQAEAIKHGFILVDTKYEFGIDENGALCLIDECHTPDSSRFWDKLFLQSYDKEYVRQWVRTQCDPYQDKSPPHIPNEIINETNRRYTKLYESLTNQSLRTDTCAALSAS